MPQSLVWATGWIVMGPPLPPLPFPVREGTREGGGASEARGHLGITVCPSANISGASLTCLALAGVRP